jgi:phenylacetate-CoA ligase
MIKKFLNFFKNNRIPIPIWLGLMLARIPYNKRPGLGKMYQDQQCSIQKFDNFSEIQKEEYIYRQFIKIFTHAYNHVKFYHDLYRKHNIRPEDICSFKDIEKVPIITKADLANYDIEDRSYPIYNRMIVNTGGSSGKPFSFYMDPQRYGNEWAHIHDMWSKFGFVPSDLKLSFDGRVKRTKGKIVYDFARNSLLYDVYEDAKLLAQQILTITKKHKIKYLHGYPSAIFEFALYCESDIVLRDELRSTLKAAFLSSEFPSPHYRRKIEEVFGIPTQSFYGHTETCIMAVEQEQFTYKAYQTYGHAEAIKVDNQFHLIGTSYYNFASPLIRYDTSDLIEPIPNNSNIMSTFRIKEGRSGEFVLDKLGKRIPLTGLIYGRHHELFNICDHIQISQKQQGEATILYVTKHEISMEDASVMFDKRNVEIKFSFKKIRTPILTSSGKANLLVKSSYC